jgi:predicted nucleic acid-binding protein
MAQVVVADTSVLIALAQIGQLPLLERLYADVVIPHAVQSEVAPSLPTLPPWIHMRTLQRPLDSRVGEASLDAGETEAISLALETRAEWVILDDLRARRLAKNLGLAVVGTAGVLFAAKQRGFIGAVRPPLDALRAAGFRLRKEVYEEILKAAGEIEPEA